MEKTSVDNDWKDPEWGADYNFKSGPNREVCTEKVPIGQT